VLPHDALGADDDPFRSPLRIRGARDEPIESLGDWLCLAPPAGRARQWRQGRSARELAAAWLRPLRPALPEELALLLVSRPETSGFAAGLALPEAKLRLDRHAGATRNADLLLFGTAKAGRTLITVEAKADEPFGPYVSGALAEVEDKPGSNLPARIDVLASLLFGNDFDAGHLRYQLLHGLGATVLEALARNAHQAVFAIHEFRTSETLLAKHEANHQDLREFMSHFGAEYMKPGILQAITISGAPHLPVFVGITRTDTTATT
jgi:hypothetical protein